MSNEIELGKRVLAWAKNHGLKSMSGGRLSAHRVTGAPGKSGLFRCYEAVPRLLGGGLNSRGKSIWTDGQHDFEWVS